MLYNLNSVIYLLYLGKAEKNPSSATKRDLGKRKVGI